MVGPSSPSASPSRRDESPADETPPTTQLPEDPILLPPSPSTTSPPPRRRRCRKVRIVRPAKDSLYDIARQHPGTSLVVRPSSWTDQHATLLGARFSQLPRCDSPSPSLEPASPPSKGHLQPSPAIKTLSAALSEILLPDSTYTAANPRTVAAILSTLWPASFSGKPQFAPELPIFFGERVYRDAARPHVMWSHPARDPPPPSVPGAGPVDPNGSSPAPPLPMLCYVNRGLLIRMRYNIFRLPPGPGLSYYNEPVSRLHRARSKALLPAIADHDVQIVAIFLTMAQRYFYKPPPATFGQARWWVARRPDFRPDFHDIKLRIMMHDTETTDFILYTATVTAQFLDRFHDPYKTPRGTDGTVPGLEIEYARIPIWPILGLRERLGKALGEDIVGPFDPTVMETWETDAEATAAAEGNRKRKRGALAEVFNGSFDESTDDEPDCLGVKSRRLANGPRVGLVA